MQRIISIELIMANREPLLKLSNLNEIDIVNIWMKFNEKQMDDFSIGCAISTPSTLLYNFEMPLYQQMILKFRYHNNEPTRFLKEINTHNKIVLQRYFKFNIGDTADKLIEFFSWMNRLSIMDLVDCCKFTIFDTVKSSEIYQQWKTNETIQFFFSIKPEQQQYFIEVYNTLMDELNLQI
jgi:hypothetical protein